MLPFSKLNKLAHRLLRGKFIPNPTSLGEKIRNKRLELRLLQKDVAKLIGISEDCLTYWENNRSEPSVRYYPRIIAFLGYYPFSKENNLAGLVKSYRYKYGLTQKKMGKRIGLNGSTICDWETGETKPKGKYLEKLKLSIE